MKRILMALAASAMTAGTALAQNDAQSDTAAGEKAFRKCKACHAIVDPEGIVIVKGGRVGPNLWGVIGRPAASQEDFRYSASLIAARDAGLVWTRAEMVKWLTDPKGYLRDYLGDDKARSKMTFRLGSGAEALADYLAALSPAKAQDDNANAGKAATQDRDGTEDQREDPAEGQGATTKDGREAAPGE